MSILCIGQSAYDIAIPVWGPITDNHKYRIQQEYHSGGGPAFNAACLCALWGASTYLISRIGNDDYGEILIDILKNYGVKCDCLIREKGFRTPYSYIFVDNITGNRTIFNRSGSLSGIGNYVQKSIPNVILTDGHEVEISIELIKKYPFAQTIMDAGTCRGNVLEVAKCVDYLICSEDFARQYTNERIDLNDFTSCQNIFNQVKQINHKVVVITLGEKGLLYEEQGQLFHLPAYNAKVVDTTGAGDIFHGAFAYGVDQKIPFLENLKQSAMAAAISLGTLGSQKSIPRLEQVRSIRDSCPIDRIHSINHINCNLNLAK